MAAKQGSCQRRRVAVPWRRGLGAVVLAAATAHAGERIDARLSDVRLERADGLEITARRVEVGARGRLRADDVTFRVRRSGRMVHGQAAAAEGQEDRPVWQLRDLRLDLDGHRIASQSAAWNGDLGRLQTKDGATVAGPRLNARSGNATVHVEDGRLRLSGGVTGTLTP